MPFSFSQLLRSYSPAEYLRILVQRLRASPTGSVFAEVAWREGSVFRTLVELFAESFADQSSQLVAIARGGFLELASHDWLTLLASELYSVERWPATTAVIDITLYERSGRPQTIQPGALWVATADGQKRFQNQTGGVLPASGELTLSFRAEAPGSRYNVGPGLIRQMLTPIPGVECRNLQGPEDAGADEETDSSLRGRCRARWASLGAGATAAAYRYWCEAAHRDVRKVRVEAVPASGEVHVTLTAERTGLPDAVVTQVQQAVQDRAPLCVLVSARSAAVQLVSIVATVFVDGRFASAYRTAAVEELDRRFATLGIGDPIYRSEIIEALTAPIGVRNVDVDSMSPSADIWPGGITHDTNTILILGDVRLTTVEV